MPIKPVDFQITYPKTQEASKVSSDEQQKNQAIYQQQLSRVRQNSESSTRQVHSQGNIYKVEDREKQERDRKNRGKENKENREKKALYNKDRKSGGDNTSTIDVRL